MVTVDWIVRPSAQFPTVGRLCRSQSLILYIPEAGHPVEICRRPGVASSLLPYKSGLEYQNRLNPGIYQYQQLRSRGSFCERFNGHGRAMLDTESGGARNFPQRGMCVQLRGPHPPLRSSKTALADPFPSALGNTEHQKLKPRFGQSMVVTPLRPAMSLL
jgi:hypothetical protein